MADVNIGDVVARLRIDTSQLAQGMQQAQQAFAQFQRTVQSSASQTQHVTQAHQQLTTSLNQITQATQQATQAQSSWRRALEVAGGVGLATSLQGIVSSLQDFAAETVRLGVRLEQLRASLSAIAGSTNAGAERFRFLFETAQRLGFGLEGLSRGFQLLSGATRGTVIAGEETRRIFEAVATAARAMGASQQQVERALLAIGQIVSKGTVQMEELRGQLAEAIPGAVQMTARAFGVTEEALNKMVETGQVRAIPMIRALTNQMQQELGPAAQQAAQTAGAAFARLANEILAARDALAQELMPALKAAADTAAGALRILREHREAQELLQRTQREEALIGTRTPLTPETTRLADELRDIRRQQQAVRAQIAAGEGGGIAGAFAPPVEQNRQYLQQLMEQEQNLMEAMRLVSEQNKAQQALTANVNQTKNARQQELDNVEAIRKKLVELQEVQQRLRMESQTMPSVIGLATGTPEQIERFRQEEQKRTRPLVEQLTSLMGERQRFVTPLPLDLEQQVKQAGVAFENIEKARDAATEAEQRRKRTAREAEQETQRQAREAEQAAEKEIRQLQQIVRERERNFEQLERLAESYGMAKVSRDAATAAELAASLATSEHAAKAREYAEVIKGVAAIEAHLPRLRREAELSAPAGERAIQAAQDAAAFAQRVQQQIDQQLATRTTRPEARLRAEAERGGVAITPELDAQLKRLTALREEQERLNQVIDIWSDLASGVGSAWGSAMQGIASHTKTVAEAFREMGRSILQTMGQIANQEAFKALFRLGASVITGALTGGGQVGFGAGSGFDVGLRNAQPLPALALASGGVVTRPTLALMGEQGREYVLNQTQMSAMQSALRTGDRDTGGGEVHVHNHPSRESAERAAAQDRAAGHRAVVNEVMADLSAGEGSRIGGMLRRMQR